MYTKKSVANVSLSRTNDDTIELTIKDEHSHDNVMKLSFTTHELGLLITGLCGVKPMMEFNEKAQIAKVREIQTVTVEDGGGHSREQLKFIVNNDFTVYHNHSGWELHDDGTTRQQPNFGSHNYVIKRYNDVDESEVLNVEKYY